MGGLLCIGEMVVDFLPGEEEGVYIRKPGGAPANVAVAASRNGVDAGFCGRVGDDDFGRFLVAVLRENNVRVLCPELVKEAITTMAFVSLDSDGDRHFTFARKPGADMFLTKNDVDKAFIMRPSIVHCGSCSLSEEPASSATLYAMEKAKSSGSLVSFDVNYRSLMWNDDRLAASKAVRNVLPMVDLLKISEEEEEILGSPIPKVMERYSISAVVETFGADGAQCFWRGERFRIPGRRVKCVDATGAGDAFWGGFLSYLLSHGVSSASALTASVLKYGLKYGNIAGSLCVGKKGAMESLPTTEEIVSILEEER